MQLEVREDLVEVGQLPKSGWQLIPGLIPRQDLNIQLLSWGSSFVEVGLSLGTTALKVEVDRRKKAAGEADGTWALAEKRKRVSGTYSWEENLKEKPMTASWDAGLAGIESLDPEN